MPALLRVAILALAVAAFPPTVGAQLRTPGVTDTEVVIGVTAPLSGPAAIYGNLALAKVTAQRTREAVRTLDRWLAARQPS